jgi:hypothetical protein
VRGQWGREKLVDYANVSMSNKQENILGYYSTRCWNECSWYIIHLTTHSILLSFSASAFIISIFYPVGNLEGCESICCLSWVLKCLHKHQYFYMQAGHPLRYCSTLPYQIKICKDLQTQYPSSTISDCTLYMVLFS